MRLIARVGVLGHAVLCACPSSSDVAVPTEWVFRAESDTGLPLSGVSISIDGAPHGETDQSGVLMAATDPTGVDRVMVGYRCPAEHSPREAQRPVPIRPSTRLGSGRFGPVEITLRCDPRYRILALVVRVLPPTELPILVDGAIVANTNEDGIALLTVKADPGTHVEVGFDTSKHSRLVPTSPSKRFVVGDKHDVLIHEQRFDLRETARRRRIRRRIIKIE